MSQPTLELRPLCFVPDPTTGGVVGFAVHEVKDVAVYYILIRSSNPIWASINTPSALQWEILSSTNVTFSRLEALQDKNLVDCITDNAGAFGVAGIGDTNSLVWEQYSPKSKVWDSLLLRTGWRLVPKTLTKPVQTSAGVDASLFHAASTEEAGVEVQLRQRVGTEDELLVTLNMGESSDPNAVVRMVYENDLLYYYHRTKGVATLTTIPVNNRTVIIDRTLQGMQTTDISWTNICESEEFAGILNGQFYYLCRGQGLLFLSDRTKRIGSMTSDSIVTSFTPFDPSSPKALLQLLVGKVRNQEVLAGMNLQDVSMKTLEHGVIAKKGDFMITDHSTKPNPVLPAVLGALALLVLVVVGLWFGLRRRRRRRRTVVLKEEVIEATEELVVMEGKREANETDESSHKFEVTEPWTPDRNRAQDSGLPPAYRDGHEDAILIDSRHPH